MLFRHSFPLLLLLALVSGCGESARDEPTTDGRKLIPSPDSPDDPEAVMALKEIGAHVEISGDGNIIELNLRETAASDDTLVHVAKLKRVRSLLLNDLNIHDDGLAHLANWDSPVVNLDLRGCKIGNDGLSHLKKSQEPQSGAIEWFSW